MPRWRQAKAGIVWLGLLLPLAVYGSNILRRPSLAAVTSQPLFRGITYSRQIAQTPRPQVIHIVDVDLATPGLKPLATPGYEGATPNKGGGTPEEMLAQRTSEFVADKEVQLAINANFFYPFHEVTPWNYGPRSGQRVNVVGIGMSDGELVSMTQPDTPSLCFTEQQAEIRAEGDCPNGLQAVAGKTLLLENGLPTEEVQSKIKREKGKPYPFTIVALDSSGTRLWIVLADGKQPLYAEGITLQEATDLVQSLGAATALQLDGGGSTTVAMATSDGPKVLNSPIHAKVPSQQRPVANHLGFFAEPVK